MKCLSVQQPWAGLIVAGLKKIEFRSWRTSHRGTILIHSSLRYSKIQRELAVVNAIVDKKLLDVKGAIIGEANLVDCRPAVPEDCYDALCEIQDGMFAWVMTMARPLPSFISFKGKLGLFEVNI